LNLLVRKKIITKKEANCVKSIVQKRGHLNKREAKSVGERSIYIEKRYVSCIRMRLLRGQRGKFYRT
jgi:hypothetical protein